MDPFSALGAASAVIGIAGFALDLSVGLYKIASQMRSAKDSINSLGQTVESTAAALDEVELLVKEQQDLIQGGKSLRMFSVGGLHSVQKTADKCLIVLWKIEALAAQGDEPNEQELASRLSQRHNSPSNTAIKLDESFTNPSLGFWSRFAFAVSTIDKLKEYGTQLHEYQTTLGTIFHIMTLGHLLRRNSLAPTYRERIALAKAKEALRRIQPNIPQVAQSITQSQPSPTQQVSQSLEAEAAETGTRSTNINDKDLPNSDEVPEPTLVKNREFRLSSPSVADIISEQDPGSCASEECSSIVSVDTARSYTTHSRNDSETSHPNMNTGAGDHENAILHASSAPDLMRLYTLQRLPGGKFHRKELTHREEKMTHDEILRRLVILDKDPLSVLDKKLSLTADQQRGIGLVEAELNKDNGPSHCWNLRQLEFQVHRGRLGRLHTSWGTMAIVIYFQRHKNDEEAVRLWHLARTKAIATDNQEREKSEYEFRTMLRHRLMAFGVPGSQVEGMINARGPMRAYPATHHMPGFMRLPPPPPPPPLPMKRAALPMMRAHLPPPPPIFPLHPAMRHGIPTPPQHHESNRTTGTKTRSTRMARRHLSLEVLRRRGIEWELDQNPEYVVIKGWVPKEEQQELWSLTKVIRGERERVETKELNLEYRGRRDASVFRSPMTSQSVLPLSNQGGTPRMSAQQEVPQLTKAPDVSAPDSAQTDVLDDATIQELMKFLMPETLGQGGSDEQEVKATVENAAL